MQRTLIVNRARMIDINLFNHLLQLNLRESSVLKLLVSGSDFLF